MNMMSTRPTQGRRRAAVLATAVAVAVSGVAACATDQPQRAGGQTGETLTVYSGQHEQTVKQLTGDFTARTGIRVELRSGNEAELANQLLQEGTASPADVFWAGNPPPMEAIRAAGQLDTVPSGTLAAVPAKYNSPAQQWIGVTARSGALVYNTDQLKPTQLPPTLQELAGPAWKGRFAFAPTETDFSPIVTAVAKLRGVKAAESFLAGLKANGKPYEDNEAVVAAVNRGEVQTGLVEHYYWYRLNKELGAAGTRSALHYFAPGDPGGLLAVSGAGVLRSSKHKDAAQRLLAYLVSPEAQTMIAASDNSFEYPLATGITSRQALRPLDQLAPPALAPVDLGDGKQTLRLLQQANLL